MQKKSEEGGGDKCCVFCFVFTKLYLLFLNYQSVIIFIDVYSHSFLGEANQTDLSSEKKDNNKY